MCKSPGQMMKQIVADRMTPQQAEYPGDTFLKYPELWELLDWCWKRDPKDRPNLDAVIEHVSRFLNGQFVLHHPMLIAILT